MSITKVKDKFGGTFHMTCDCGHFGVVDISWFDDDSSTYYLTITTPRETLSQKIKSIWRVIKGSPYGITDEIVITRKQMRKLARMIQTQLNE